MLQGQCGTSFNIQLTRPTAQLKKFKNQRMNNENGTQLLTLMQIINKQLPQNNNNKTTYKIPRHHKFLTQIFSHQKKKIQNTYSRK